MAGGVALPEGATVRIRLYRPEDRDQVYHIFRQGMEGLTNAAVRQLYSNFPSLKVLSCAVPAVALLLTPKSCGLATKTAIGVSAAAATPIVVYGVFRHFFRSYVNQSIETDMKSIETFYSVAGAGHGSAFWVAELVEAAPSTPSEGPAATPRQEVGAPSVKATAAPQQPEALAAAQAPVPAPSQPPAAARTSVKEANGTTQVDPVKSLVARLITAAIAKDEAARGVAAAPETTVDDSNSSCEIPASSVTDPLPAAPTAPATEVPAPVEETAAAPIASSSAPTSSRWTLPVPTLPTATTTAAPAFAPAPPPPRSVIVGHVGLDRKTWQVAELRRMSVAPAYRGNGIAGKLLDALVQHARDNGFKELFLVTSGLQAGARRVYEKGGWTLKETGSVKGMQLFTYTKDLIKKC